MTSPSLNQIAATTSIILFCALLGACASQPLPDEGRADAVMKAQYAASTSSKPAMGSDEADKVYSNYVDSTGKPVPPTSGMKELGN